MNFWYDNILYKVKQTFNKNELGQMIPTNEGTEEFKCDIQPIDEKSYKYTWGEDVKSSIQIFTDKDLFVNDILVNDNKAYKIEKKIDWGDYKIYAILESD